ncbi:MAG: hypothetical protein MRECE_3c029 [Mycoplasmataceae bacterium CE_OT135]|nr:MAG: hypothetical protein MRECE_3c029 [Mycoplasmataceae bacterium CE_OT135]
MGKNNENDLTLFRQVIMWVEQYIEQTGFYSDWKQRKQTDYNSYIKWVDNQTPTDEILKSLGLCLNLEFGHNGKGKDWLSPKFRETVKTEFYKWINATKIDNNCPQELKQVLFRIHEVMENKEGGYKLFKSLENSKRELEPDSPEYQEQLKFVFSVVSEAHASGKAFEVDNGRFNGNAEAGKATFEAIANSLSASDKENFHFWPQMTEEEKAEEERKNKERQNHPNPILQTWRTNSIAKITAALNQEPKLTNSDLEPKNQNWEVEINLTEDIVKIQGIQNHVLTDIKEKRQTLLQKQESQKTTKIILISGGILIAGLSLIGLVFYFWKRKNGKRK